MKQRYWLFLILFVLAVCGAPVAQAQDDVGNLLGRVNGLRSGLGLHPYGISSALSAAGVVTVD